MVLKILIFLFLACWGKKLEFFPKSVFEYAGFIRVKISPSKFRGQRDYLPQKLLWSNNPKEKTNKNKIIKDY